MAETAQDKVYAVVKYIDLSAPVIVRHYNASVGNILGGHTCFTNLAQEAGASVICNCNKFLYIRKESE